MSAGRRRTPEEALFLGEVLPATEYILHPGRNRKDGFLHFRAITSRHLEEHGSSLEQVVVGLFQVLWENARMGDMVAVKLLLDKICGKDAEHVAVAMAQLSDTERAARIEAIFDAARGRSPPAPNGHGKGNGNGSSKQRITATADN